MMMMMMMVMMMMMMMMMDDDSCQTEKGEVLTRTLGERAFGSSLNTSQVRAQMKISCSTTARTG